MVRVREGPAQPHAVDPALLRPAQRNNTTAAGFTVVRPDGGRDARRSNSASTTQPIMASGISSLPAGTRRPRLRIWLLAGLVGLAGWLAAATPARADHAQASIFEDDYLMTHFPVFALSRAQGLGLSTVRLSVRWQQLAPRANSFRGPRHFDASNPAAYAAQQWAPYDTAVRDAAKFGIHIDLDLLGGAPLWATGAGMPRQRGYPFHNWKPSAVAFGRFARAVATRYSGNYDPDTGQLDPGNADDLPRVSLWSVWNEPNFGPGIAPQTVPHSANLAYSPRVYRSLVDQMWSALHASGHGSDTVLIGELAPHGVLKPGNFNMMTPLIFMRGLYCVNAAYRPLRGSAAVASGCPTTARGSAGFAHRHPGLFQASGVSDHPYMRWYPPNRELDEDQPAGFRQLKSDYASLATIGNLTRGLTRMTGAYRSHRRVPIWVTEFAYITDPPVRVKLARRWHYPSPKLAAEYDNWAEYIAWRNPQIVSWDQYLLQDASKPSGGPNAYGFPSGLINAGGSYKAGYAAFRTPLYLPKTTASSATAALEVWGAVRPVYFGLMDQPGTAQSVTVQFEPAGSGSYQSLAVEPISSPEGYFDAHLSFPSSGTVRLAYTYPPGSLLASPGTVVYSRTVRVQVK